MFIPVFLLCFLLYHMSPRDSVMTCAHISVPHLLGSSPLSTTFSLSCLLPISFRLGSFSLSATFAPTRSFSSYPQLEQLPLFSHFCPNLLFHFLCTIGASSPFFSLLPQLAFSLPVRNWSIFFFFLTFAPTCSSIYNPRLEHLPIFLHIYPNPH